MIRGWELAVLLHGGVLDPTASKIWSIPSAAR
jgi:hypothetical protein